MPSCQTIIMLYYREIWLPMWARKCWINPKTIIRNYCRCAVWHYPAGYNHVVPISKGSTMRHRIPSMYCRILSVLRRLQQGSCYQMKCPPTNHNFLLPGCMEGNNQVSDKSNNSCPGFLQTLLVIRIDSRSNQSGNTVVVFMDVHW